MFRSAIGILLLAGTVLGQPQTRGELISALVKKGDAVSVKSKSSARSAYLFALFFAKPDNPIADQARRKVDSLGVIPVELSAPRFHSGDSGAPLLLPRDLLAFPKRTPESDLVDLRMLLDDRLVGDTRYGRAKSGMSAFIFLSEPLLSMNEIRKTYGAPTTERTTVNGREVLTYGMFRIFSDAWGRASLVVFGQSTEPRP